MEDSDDDDDDDDKDITARWQARQAFSTTTKELKRKRRPNTKHVRQPNDHRPRHEAQTQLNQKRMGQFRADFRMNETTFLSLLSKLEEQ